MKNTTISIDEKTLENARSYAARLGYSFNAWVNKLIGDAVTRSPTKSMNELLSLADECVGSSGGKKWTRDELYER